jgi:hypothetical protein
LVIEQLFADEIVRDADFGFGEGAREDGEFGEDPRAHDPVWVAAGEDAASEVADGILGIGFDGEFGLVRAEDGGGVLHSWDPGVPLEAGCILAVFAGGQEHLFAVGMDFELEEVFCDDGGRGVCDLGGDLVRAHRFHDGADFWAGDFFVSGGVGGGSKDTGEGVEDASSALFADDFHDVVDLLSGDGRDPFELGHSGEVLPVGILGPVDHGVFDVFAGVFGEDDEGEDGSEVGVSEAVLNGDGCEFFEGHPGEVSAEADELVVRVDEGVEFGFGEQGRGVCWECNVLRCFREEG